jgi:hypothetical protein
MSEPASDLPSPGRMAGGMALIVIGLLILVPSGLCTAAFGIGALSDMFSSPSAAQEAFSIMLEVLLFGGPFIAVGAALFYAGRRMRRRS